MEAQDGAGILELTKEIQSSQTALVVPGHGTGDESGTSLGEEEEGGIPIPAPGLLQVTERRQPLSSVSSLEVHFDLLDLTELTDMSDQELAEVFADSDDENATNESPAGRRAKYYESNNKERALAPALQDLGQLQEKASGPIP